MRKKNRTGLQSEVSHIFAGVPIPKKRRSRSGHPEQKQETKEAKQTPAEEIPVEQPPAEEHPVLQPPAEEPAAELQAEESQVLEPPVEQEQLEETPTEQLMAPPPQIEEPIIEEPSVTETPVKEPNIVETPDEEPTFKQPPVIEPPVEQTSVPFSQTIEVPELEESVEAVKEPSSVTPVQSGITERRTVKTPRKVTARPKDKRLASKPAAGSRRQITMAVLAIALSILLVFLLVKPFSQSSPNTGGTEVTEFPAPGITAKTGIESMKIEWSRPPIYPTDIRDPMEAGSARQFYYETDTPIVRGISYGEENKYAIMSTGAIVQEGDEIFGWKVIKINPNSVVFEKNGQTLTRKTQGENNQDY